MIPPTIQGPTHLCDGASSQQEAFRLWQPQKISHYLLSPVTVDSHLKRCLVSDPRSVNVFSGHSCYFYTMQEIFCYDSDGRLESHYTINEIYRNLFLYCFCWTPYIFYAGDVYIQHTHLIIIPDTALFVWRNTVV